MPPLPIFVSPFNIVHVVTQEFAHLGHRGIDLGINQGTLVFSRGNGRVTRVVPCTICTPANPNFRSQGIQDGTQEFTSALASSRWGFGFGNFIVVRYAWGDLPESVHDEMTHRGLANGFAYVIHAHLQRTDVQVNDPVDATTQLGMSGNTGNSTGPHLHLEVRISLNGNAIATGSFPSINPRIMYDL